MAIAACDVSSPQNFTRSGEKMSAAMKDSRYTTPVKRSWNIIGMQRTDLGDLSTMYGSPANRTSWLASLTRSGAIVLRIKLSRTQLTQRLANIPPCLIGMEACAGAHHIGRQLQALGHDVRLIPAQYVKPFLKGHKNDYRDAEAIAEAV